MKHTCLSLLFVVATVSLLRCQTLSPTELESVTLAKLKAQHDVEVTRLQVIDTQIRLLQVTRTLEQQQEQVRLSELQGKAEQVIKEHKWEATYNSDQTETGTFVSKAKVETKGNTEHRPDAWPQPPEREKK